MAEKEGLNGSVGLDTTAFKTGITQLTSQMKSIETGFRASAAVMGDWSTKSDGLKERTASLSDKLTLQKQALEILHTEYDKVVMSEGAGSKAAESLANQMFSMEGKITSTNKSLDKYQTQLKTVESQEKGNTSSLAKFKSGLVSLADQSKKSTSSISSGFGSLKGVIAGFAAGLVSSLSLSSIISGAATAEKTTAQMNAVLKSTGGVAGMTADSLNALAAAQAKVTTYSAGTTKQAENMMLTFTGVSSKTFPAAIKAAEDYATATGTSATSAAKLLGKALNDPAAGLTKLTRVGIVFTAAQKEQITSMEKAGNTAGAQGVMIDALTKKYGGSAIAAGNTTSGQIQKMTNSVKGACVTITAALLPIVASVLPSIVKAAQDLATAVTAHKAQITGAVSAISTVVKGIFSFVEGHGPLIKGVIIGLVTVIGLWKAAMLAANTVTTVHNALTALGIISTEENTAAVAAQSGATIGGTVAFLAHGVALGAIAVAHGVASAAMGVATAAQWLLNAALTANPIGIVIVAVGALVAALVILFNNNKTFHDWILSAISAIQTAFFTALNAVKSFFTTTFNGIVGFVKSNWQELLLFIVNPIAGALALLYKLNPRFKTWVDGIADAIKAGLNAAIKFITDLPAEAINWGKDLINGIVSGINSAIGAVKTAVGNVAQSIRSFLHFSVPDTGPLSDADKYGKDFMDLLAKTISDNKDAPSDAAKKVATLVSAEIAKIKANTTVSVATTKSSSTTSQTGIKTGEAAQLKTLNAQLEALEAQHVAKMATLTGTANTAARTAATTTYNAKVKVINNEITAVKDQATKEIAAVKDKATKVVAATQAQSTKEIAAIQKVGTAYQTELTKEAADKATFVTNVNNLETEVVDALKEKYTEDEKNQEDAINAELDNLETWKTQSEDNITAVYTAKEAAIEATATASENAIQAEIDALDTQTAAETRAATQKTYTDKISDLQSQITYSHDDYNKAELEKSLATEQADYQTELNTEATADKKTTLQTQLDAVKAAATAEETALATEKQSQLDTITAIYTAQKTAYDNELTAAKNTYTAETTDAALQAEAEKLIVSNKQDDIIALLKTYSDQYKATGTTLGDSLAAGFQPAIDNIKSMIASINADISSAQSSASAALTTAAQAAASSATAAASSTTTNSKTTSVTVNVAATTAKTASQIATAAKAAVTKALFQAA